MAGSTVKAAVCSLGLTLWDRFRTCPFHDQEVKGSEYTPNVREYLAAMVSISPACKYQKAITPEFLWCMACATSSEIFNNHEDHAANIIIGAYFFAMQSCEFSSVPSEGSVEGL